MRTILGRIVDYAIWLNGVLLPASSAEAALGRYTCPLVALNGNDEFPITLIGSCIGVLYRERYIVVCTRHQVKDWDPESVGILSETGSHWISSGGFRRFFEINDSEYHDLAAFDFTDPCAGRPELREKFFRFTSLPHDTLSDQVVCFIASGFPFADQDYDLANGGRLGQARRYIPCFLDGSNQSSDQSLLRIRPRDPLLFDPNGLSGGPVFVVQIIEGQGHAFFAGIMTRAGRNHIYIVRSGFILRFLDGFIDQMSSDGEF